MDGASTLVIVGAGGFARELSAWAAHPAGGHWRVVGVVSPEPPDARLLASSGGDWLGDDESFLANPTESHVVLAIGSNVVRARLASRYEARGLQSATLIHPTASIGPDIGLGEGSIVCAQASLSVDIRVGRHVHVDRAVTVGHDADIGDFASLHPGAVISGGVFVGESAEIGASACILPGRVVGQGARVGAGAVVTRDVAPGETVVGVPARPIGGSRA